MHVPPVNSESRVSFGHDRHLGLRSRAKFFGPVVCPRIGGSYVHALDRLIALEPEMILPAHFDRVEGQACLHKSLTVMRDGVQYVYDETVAGMNAGKSVFERWTRFACRKS